jgi:hypothetical protein
LTVSRSTEDWEVLGLDQKLDAARDAGGPPDEAGAFEGEHHLMDAGWRDLEVPLHVGFRGRLAEDTTVGLVSTTVVAAASFDYAVILIRGGVSDGCFGLVWRVAAVG